MAYCLGKFPREIGEMTLPEVDDLVHYWRHQPPVHVLVAAYLGYGGPGKSEGDLTPAEFFERFKATGGKIDGMTPR